MINNKEVDFKEVDLNLLENEVKELNKHFIKRKTGGVLAKLTMEIFMDYSLANVANVYKNKKNVILELNKGGKE